MRPYGCEGYLNQLVFPGNCDIIDLYNNEPEGILESVHHANALPLPLIHYSCDHWAHDDYSTL
jgi:hypothetical protein